MKYDTYPQLILPPLTPIISYPNMPSQLHVLFFPGIKFKSSEPICPQV